MDKKTAGLLICLGVAAAATVLLPRVSKLKTPANSAGRAATRAGLLLYGKTREVVAEMGEIVDDLVAEVEASIAAAHAHDDTARQEAEQKGGVTGNEGDGAADESAEPAAKASATGGAA